jgi:CPA1 family monovalent cation:H+ antiporter
MQTAQSLIALLFAVSVIAALSKRVAIPYPILLVIGGVVMGFLPLAPPERLDPDLILLLFLPPLLYSDAFHTSWIDFRRWLRPIVLLSTGLVAATTIAVGAVAKHFAPELPWSVALLLGAVVSPTDTVAAQAILERIRMPRRFTAILGGESLVNDATGLVGFQIATLVTLSGEFDARGVGLTFLWVAAAGVGIGLGVGWLAARLNRLVRDPQVLFSLSVLAPYVAYVVCSHLGASGVLAVVTAGFYVAWRIHEIPADARFQLFTVWELAVFLINGFCFVLIGLELPRLREGLERYDPSLLAALGVSVSLAVIVARLVWVYPGAYLPRWLSRRVREREQRPRLREVLVVGWCGMRGVVSLAAALSIPLALPDGTPFPGRDLVVFAVLCVIVATLVLQGLTLEPLIRRLGIRTDALSEDEERAARIGLVKAALAHLAGLRDAATCSAEEVAQAEAAQRARLAALESQTELREQLEVDRARACERHAQLGLIDAQRKALLELRSREAINDLTQLRLLGELDLEEMRLLR